jgi:hypothetical protein
MPDPKVEFRDQAKDDLDFEDALGDALCVFKSGGVDSDLLEQNDKQILFYLDLENETIVDKDKAKVEGDSEDPEDRPNFHPMLFNQYPLCNDHSLLLLFA